MDLYAIGKNKQPTVKIYFVQDGASCSTEMKNAFSVCERNSFHPKIISDDSVLETNDYESNVVYVLENFIGEAFEFLSGKACLVLGPSCINICISERIPIPSNGSSVYNIALRGVVICSTALRGKDRDEIKKLSNYMGAIYSDDLTLAVTHLIAENISSLMSGKCGKAIENNIPIISPEWIKKSWEATLMGSKAPDASNFKLPPFKGMHISCSNLSMSVKKKLQLLIDANGGIYQKTLEMNKTVVLVVGEAEGKKWQFAQQWGIPCVAPSWIYESVERGYLAPSKKHLVEARPRCSTPTHSADNDSFMSSNVSLVPCSSERSKVDETNTSISSEMSIRSVRSEVRVRDLTAAPDEEYKKLLEGLSIRDIRTAGLFLDGCKIFLSGFTPLEFEKLKKLINAGGATLFPSVSDCLSHIVVGKFSLSDVKEFSCLNPRPHVVKLDWLIQCLKEKTTVNVEPYLCLQPSSAPPASPLSNKGLKLLKSQNGMDSIEPVTPTNESRAHVSRKLFVKAAVVKPSLGATTLGGTVDVSALEQHALEEMNKEKEEQKEREKEESLRRDEEEKGQKDLARKHSFDHSKETTLTEGDQSTVELFFQGLCFEIHINDEDQKIKDSIELVGGKLFSEPPDNIPDYAIVPVEGTDVRPSAKNIVTLIFLEDCYDQSCLVTELEYYHKPIPGLLNAQKKLEGTVFGLSGFGRAERRLLEYIATTLGGLVQVMFSRSEYPDKGVRKSTHLVCKEMSGKKYEAALKWGVPVVTSAWLLDMIEPEKPASLSTSQILSQSMQDGNDDIEMEVERTVQVSQPLEEDPDTPPTKMKKLSISDEADIGNSAEASTIKMPEFMSTPDIIKRWKTNQLEGGSPLDPPQSIKASPPTRVLKKQLWAKYGGVSFEGIEPETGKLLPDGPYKEWARNSLSSDDSFVEPPLLTGNQKAPLAGEATPTRKRWNYFLSKYEEMEGTPPEPPKPKRPSTPLDVIKKQLWVKFGGVKFEGIEPETGKLLKDGPFGEWARNSMSSENSLVDPDKLTEDENCTESSRHLSARSSCEKSGNPVEEVERSPRKSDPCTPTTTSRLSSHSVSVEDSKNPKKRESNGDVSYIEENRPALLEFNPIHSSTVCEGINRNKGAHESSRAFSDSSKSMDETPKENVPENYSNLANSPKLQVSKNDELSNVPVTKSNKIFLLSGLSAVAKQKYEGIIQLLGAGLTQCSTYDPSTTHIIIEKPIRSEKLLCCIASGKWVLHSSYLDFCYEARQFLNEEEFEWGNPVNSTRLPKLLPGSTEAGLANASYKWRLKRRDMGSAAPFRDMRVTLFTSENKEPQFRRLLEAGGATILPRSEILLANYIIWEHERVAIDVPLTSIAARKIHVVPPVYLGEYLVKAPHPAQHYPPPYLKVVKEMKASKK